MWAIDLIRTIVSHLRSHSLAYTVASLGFEIDALYFTYLFTGPHFLQALVSIETMIILLAIPSFIAVGHLSEKRIQLEQSFEEYSNNFDKKVEEMNKTLQKTTEELKGLDEMKDTIITNVSHELKTPLTIAMSGLELAMEEESKEERDKLLHLTMDSFHRQKGVIDNLLAISRLKKGTYKSKMEGLDIIKIINSALGDVQARLKNRGITSKVYVEEDLPMIRGNSEKLEHAFNNLLENAIKFNKEGGKIRINASQKGDFVEVTLEDTGIGIANDQQEKIFDNLYQVDPSTSREYSGTGVGIAVAKGIIETHGGQIGVESTLGEGTTLHFTLPIDDSKDLEERVLKVFRENRGATAKEISLILGITEIRATEVLEKMKSNGLLKEV